MDLKYKNIKTGDLLRSSNKECYIAVTQTPGSYEAQTHIQGIVLIGLLVLDKKYVVVNNHNYETKTAEDIITWVYGMFTCTDREVFLGWARLRDFDES
jgi:hypothetical protein